MKNKPAFLLALTAFVLLTASGCQRRRLQKTPVADSTSAAVPPPPAALPPPVAPAPPKTDSTTVPAAGSTARELDFNYLVSRAKLSFHSAKTSQDNTDVNIRIRKDSLIWFNVSKLGISGVRGLATRDTITVVNVINRNYYKFSYAELSTRFGMPLSFDLLQALLVGNMPLKNTPGQMTREGNSVVVRQREGRVQLENYIGADDRKLRQLRAVDARTNNTLQLRFEDFKDLSGQLFPYNSFVTIDQQPKTPGDRPGQTTVEINTKKVELTNEPQSFNFSVPSKYERKQ